MNPVNRLHQFFVISIVAHLIAIFLFQLESSSFPAQMRQVGITGGVKNPQIFLLRQSTRSGKSPILSSPSQARMESSNASPLSKVALPAPQIQVKNSHGDIKIESQSQGKSHQSSSNPTLLTQTISGKEVQANAQQKQQADKSLFSFDGSMFDVGIIVPEGVSEDELNSMEEMFYSFRKRVAEQYINQVQLMIGTMEKRYPRTSFPWTAKAQQLRAKLTYDEEGNLLRIEDIKKSEVKLLQEYFREVTNEIYKIPNPPRAILNSNHQFELILGLNIIE